MNDTVIFLVLAGLALIFKWLTKQGPDDSEKTRPTLPNETPRHPLPQTEEERVRRFLEALGVPPGTTPPPPVRSRTVTPRPAANPPSPPKVRRSWVQPLPPVVTTPPPLTTTWQPEPVVVPEAPPAPEAPAPPPLPVEIAAPVVRTAAPVPSVPLTPLGTMLRSRQSIRQAIVLREILGPPRGLEPLGQFPVQ